MPRAKNNPRKRGSDANSLTGIASCKKGSGRREGCVKGLLEELRDSADFHLRVKLKYEKEEEGRKRTLETMVLKVRESEIEEFKKDFRLYLNEQVPGQSFVMDDQGNHGILEENSVSLIMGSLKGLFRNKSGLFLEFEAYDSLQLSLKLQVKMSIQEIKSLSHPSNHHDAVSFESKALTYRYFLKETLEKPQILSDDFSKIIKPDVDALYDRLKNFHESYSAKSMTNPQHPSLIPKLRPYQIKAVEWMIGQESRQNQNESLHPLYIDISSDGTPLYLNKYSGFIVKEFPKAIPRPPGGILADEMGLGKTVEIISLILCHPRTGLKKPMYMKPVKDIVESTKRKSSRKRAVSPTEFEIKNDRIIQVDGNNDESASDFTTDDESESPDYLPSYKYDSDDDNDSDKEYKPRPSTSRSKPITVQNLKQSVLSDQPSHQIDFDPTKYLKCKNVTSKSSLSDLIIASMIKLIKGDYLKSCSAIALKKNLEREFNKNSSVINKNVNKILSNLVGNGTLLSTSTGANGSFRFNLDKNNFDSRGLYLHCEDEHTAIIEDVITQQVYDGIPYVQNKVSNPKKKVTLYDRMKTMYDLQLKEMSEAVNEGYKKPKKRWKGSYFDTKVHQRDFFECICGADEEDDDRSKVQCSLCTIRQHAECVKFDLRDPFRGDYKCPHCWSESDPVPSKATLIVSPVSICYQWIEEIQKHVSKSGLRILFYKGTKAEGYIQPRVLAGYDVVVTTYSVLLSETNYVDLPHSNAADGRKFRNPKRFMAIPAPLPAVEWWRICLDEAQMIECTTTKTSEMALRLSSVNKWCVTGTPIGKSINDLYGLFLFLGFDPYSVNHWWKTLVFDEYSKGNTTVLDDLLCKVMWRTAKRDVLHQINIPSQTEQVHWLSFSPIEEHFYRRQHVESSRDVANKISRIHNLNIKLSELDRNTLNSVLHPMLKLRQCCCHPQVVKGQFLHIQKSSMTMEELLEQMMKKVLVECEEFHRGYISALNGLAGIHIIKEEWEEAAETYREVLGLTVEYDGKIKTDTLQKLHTVANLAELLESKHKGIPHTLRDDSLRNEAKQLKEKYLEKYMATFKTAEDALTLVTLKVENLYKDTKNSSEPWYVNIIHSVASSSDEDSLLKLVRDEMAQFYDVVNDREFKEIAEKYSNSRIILYKVSEKIVELDSLRNIVQKGVNKLRKSSSDVFVCSAVECHLRISVASRKNKDKCQLCKVHDDIEAYEKSLFHFVKGDLKSKRGNRSSLNAEENKKLEDAGVFLLEEQRVGNWTESETERLLRAILKFARMTKKGGAQNVILANEGNRHLSLLDVMKKEFKLTRILWRQIYDRVAAMDELNMSVMRLRLRYDDEPVTPINAIKRKKDSKPNSEDLSTREKDKFETIYILEEQDLPSQKLKLTSDKTIASNEFRKKYGQLLYLENLKGMDFKTTGGENPEPCPICQKALGCQWSVLQCGHCFCVECIRVLIDEYSSGVSRKSLKCAICRNLSFHSEISFVNTSKEESPNDKAEKEALEKVKGSLSSKIEAVVKTIIQIQSADTGAKSLVFSNWSDVLDILGMALDENEIPFATLHAQGKFKRNLQKFKNREDVKVLLLPITSGANGLNLIEASHVFLIEPILNPAQELQAIGRVHRIGQTKPTVVHKFLIRNTIEEKIHKTIQNFQQDEVDQGSHSTEENLLTLLDLKKIFVDDE